MISSYAKKLHYIISVVFWRTCIACSLLKTLASISNPCSVKTIGRYLVWCPLPFFKVTVCDLRALNSSWLNSNINDWGKRSIFLLTACFKTFVCTPYNSARSLSNITFIHLISKTLLTICATGNIMGIATTKTVDNRYHSQTELVTK